MSRLVEMAAEDRHQAPCRFGNIVYQYACYCHNTKPSMPCKCPLWGRFGEDPVYWKRGHWNAGGCPHFEGRS